MNRTELRIMENLITTVKNELLGIHCTGDWSPHFKATVVACEELIVEERSRIAKLVEAGNPTVVPPVIH